ncbi:MAG: hypothetical protein GVY26_22035 [Bacteroidetes bacterium]|jgi:transposase-like protein|nr:hypothetical protein [Bacteroidota bacterium]
MLRFYQLLCALFFLCLPAFSQAQYTEVSLDFESAYIGENNPLPAETNLLVGGAIPAYIDRVTISLYHHRGRDQRDPLHQAVWQRPLENKDASYSLPVNYKLRPSTEYDIEVLYFKSVSKREREALLKRVNRRLRLYLDSQRKPNGRGVNWNQKPKRLVQEMNALLKADLQTYRRPRSTTELAFSDLIQFQLEKMEQLKTSRDSSAAATAIRQAYTNLAGLMEGELERLIPSRLYELADSRYLEDCPTEEKQGVVSVSAGYGGVYLSGELSENFDYDTAPFAGLSFPLGNSAFAPRFFSNTYLGFGLFLNDFEDSKGNTLSGPIVGRPIYASLDYKLFQFVYLNLGATLLEEEQLDNSSELFVRPFIGLSAKVNLSLSFKR